MENFANLQDCVARAEDFYVNLWVIFDYTDQNIVDLELKLLPDVSSYQALFGQDSAGRHAAALTCRRPICE